MIPILFPKSETAFTNNGLGRLSDCISCEVVEERNGVYECEFTYPITGAHYSDIKEGYIVYVTHDEQGDRQPFVIYRRSAPMNGIVTFYAHHVSYKLNNVILKPMTAASVAQAFSRFENNSITGNPFTFWTDKASSGTLTVERPTAIRTVLGGTEGSILDVFGGGEYEFDKYLVRLYQNRGADNGVTIRYGKNLMDITAVYDTLDLYNAVVPFWMDTDGNVVYGGVVSSGKGIETVEFWTNESYAVITDENGNGIQFGYVETDVLPLDLSQEFDEQPTVEQLEARAATILNGNKPWLPKENITVDFVALWQTEEYENIAPLERVRLCDTVTVYYPALNVNVKTKVVSVTWDALLDRYSSIELGEPRTTFAEAMADANKKNTDEAFTEFAGTMDAAIKNATDLITGGMGGHIIFRYDADGKPMEMLVMDTEDESTAVHVLRINVNGIGFSANGVNGTYRSAWTLDGSFVADFITAGTMSANRIQGGTLTLGGANNGNGVLEIVNASGASIGTWDNTGINVTRGNLNMGTSSSFSIPFLSPSGSADNKITIDSTNGYQLNFDNTTTKTTLCVYNGFYNYPPASYTMGNQTYNFRIGDTASGTDWELDVNPCGVRANKTTFSNHVGTNTASIVLDMSGLYVDTQDYLFRYTPKDGRFYCSGTKSRLVGTPDYGDRLLYCYEMPSPVFGDMGEGVISDDGRCYVMIDGVFAETVTLSQYQVFLQKYGAGECYVAERNAAYFVVEGTPGLSFGWELKAKQSDFDQYRLDRPDIAPENRNNTDYGQLAAEYIEDLIGGRTA